jgi:hypothetical protein
MQQVVLIFLFSLWQFHEKVLFVLLLDDFIVFVCSTVALRCTFYP